MVVDPRKKTQQVASAPPATKKPLVISVALHVVVFLLIIFGMPHWKKDLEIVEPVPVQLVDNIGELTTANKPPVKAPPKDNTKPEPPKKQPKKEPPKKEPPKSTPKPEPKVDPAPPKDEDLEPAPKKEAPEKIPEKQPKKEEPKKEPKKPEPKKEDAKEDPKQQESFDSLLNDLTPEEPPQPETDETSDAETNPTPSPDANKFSNVLSMSEMDALRYQLSQCWNIMAGAQNADNLQVEVKVIVNQDRTVASAKIVDQGRYGSDAFFRAAADSAIRALNNPRCTPLNLPLDKYDSWHDMTIVFDPKEML